MKSDLPNLPLSSNPIRAMVLSICLKAFTVKAFAGRLHRKKKNYKN
jgi:hypothetical protein